MPTYLIGLIILLTRQGGDFIEEPLRNNHSVFDCFVATAYSQNNTVILFFISRAPL